MSIQYTAEQLQRKFPGEPGAPGFPRLADVLRGEGKLEEAIQMCQDGLRVRPNTLSAQLVLGKALMDSGRMEDAREPFEAALRLDPRCLSAMHYLARIMTKLQWADAAAGYYKSILEVEPWDREIRALLAETSQASSTVPSLARPADSEADTYLKPEGLAGDVLEVNLNDMASDFLPGPETDGPASMNLVESLSDESLEDALSGSSLDDGLAFPDTAKPHKEEARLNPVPDPLAEPRPMDLLKEEPIAESEALVEDLAEDAPPISGQDVEDRLDSLFGSEDGPSQSAFLSSSATWTPAPAESAGPEASATATGELSIPEADRSPVKTEEDFPGAQSTIQFAAITQSMDAEPAGTLETIDNTEPTETTSFPASETMDAVPADGFATAAATAFSEAPPAEDLAATTMVDAETAPWQDITEEDFAAEPLQSPAADLSPALESENRNPVHGEDIERRLDELFNLGEADAKTDEEVSASSIPTIPSAPAAIVTTMLPVAPDPKVGETVTMGEVVAFGGEVAFREPEVDFPAESDEDVVTGQDVADKLDTLFGEEPPLNLPKPAVAAAPAESVASAASALSGAETMGVDALGETQFSPQPDIEAVEAPPVPEYPALKPWAQEDDVPPPLPAGEVMSTESMLPPGWFGEAGDAPNITGADVEAQLDKLFDIQGEGETLSSSRTGRPKDGRPKDAPLPKDEYTGETTAFRAPAPGDEADQTLIMPALGLVSERPPLPKDAGRIKESVGEWLARQNQDADERAAEDSRSPSEATVSPFANAGLDASETMILPHEDLDALGEETDAFGTLAPEDMGALSDTASIEMVDGEEVAERLDALFAEHAEAPDGSLDPAATEMSLFAPEMETMPESALGGSPAEKGVPVGLDTEDELPPAIGIAKEAEKPAPDLAPMLDEDGYPEEEETPSGSGAGANVATVTLAEIYFQQGLREQALQIYRQLLEREPENESVRKRIEEIESAKPEGGDRGPGSDPRRPRPGLKVPKRKK